MPPTDGPRTPSWTRCQCGALCELAHEPDGAIRLHQEGARHLCVPQDSTVIHDGRVLYGGPQGAIVIGLELDFAERRRAGVRRLLDEARGAGGQ